MDEDKVLKKFAQSAKQVAREKYQFSHATLKTSVLKKIHIQNRHCRSRRIAVSISLAACLTLCGYIFLPVWNGIFFREAGPDQSATQMELIEPDEGMLWAIQNGYRFLPNIQIQKNGYTIETKDIMVDQQRIVYSIWLSGEKIETYANDKSYSVYNVSSELDVPGSIYILRNGREKEYKLVNGVHYLIIQGELFLNQDEMQNILSKPNPVIPLTVGYMNQKEVEIPLPLTEEVRLEKKVIKTTATAKAKLGTQEVLQNLVLSQLDLSPTIMHVNIQGEMKEDYEFHGLKNPRLVDGKGKEYHLAERGQNKMKTNSYSLHFIPSLYFDQFPQKLSLEFDGIVTSTRKSGNFVLERNGKYPFEVPFGNKKGRILQAYYDKDRLVLDLEGSLLSEETDIKIDGVDYHNQIFENGKWIVTYPVPKKDTYQVETSRKDTETIPVNAEVPILDN
ncbi:DUF4179 domain-containing protein [Brevibacillus antibioticus]|uniref:DUF4179 domain-containing protein n=1 Tax=Brevibacillus antibioticus TaxID=2570228 RepID=A0A4U2YD76_9BACL|nr:DUF4179 domain-containing protein [Brevibacillus antibioticus]TKI58690.1 DUF4179 domain-containing protein [Brevibacillus antibioticus]